MSTLGTPRPNAPRSERERLPLQRLRRGLLACASAGGLLCVVGWLIDPAHLYQSWLFAYVFFWGIALGSLAFLMLHHLTGGGWGIAARRPLESASMTLLLLVLLFMPLVAGMRELYPWAADPSTLPEDLAHKRPYLNPTFFLLRAAFYFVTWIVLALLLTRWSHRFGEASATQRRFRLLSAAGLVIYVLTVTFAAIDWVMSLDPRWFSMAYGWIFAAGQGVSALAFAIVLVVWLTTREPMSGFLTKQHLNDLGNLLLAFVILWTYMMFAQFLIIWYGNLAEETPWVARRTSGGWQWIALVLIVLHFAIPFVILLSRDAKRTPSILAGVAALLLAMRVIDLFWMVLPTVRSHELAIHWLDPAALLLIGGLWGLFFLWHLRRHPLLPQPQAGGAYA